MKRHATYKEEDKFIVYHDGDGTAPTTKIELPTLESFFDTEWDEAIKLIDGYGLQPKDQKFRHQVIPERIANLGAIIRRKNGLKKDDTVSLDDLYSELESDPIEYESEIRWIKTQIKRRYVGYWFFNNGKPTYIDGWHYFYLNFWPIDNQDRKDHLAFYRDVDRRIFLYCRWCYTDTFADFKYRVTYRNEIGKIKQDYFLKESSVLEFMQTYPKSAIEEGEFHIDKGYRTCYGVIFPKRRRIGATSAFCCIGYLIVTESKQRNGGLQALTGENAKKDVFIDKIIKRWRKVPFFFRPSYSGTDFPQDELLMTYPASRSKTGQLARTDDHGGRIDYRSSEEKAYDGQKLYWYHDDEGGKIKGGEVILGRRWRDVVRKTLAQGMDIHGFATFASTFGEFEAGGGKQYFDLIKDSMYGEGDDNGHTTSGLRTLFIPAYDGYDKCVDEYGMSIIYDPDTPLMGLEGHLIHKGAKTILNNTRRDLMQKGKFVELSGEKRDNPFTIKEASSKSAKSANFDQKILEERITFLNWCNPPKTRRVRLEWSDKAAWYSSKVISDVRVYDDPEGMWVVSYLPPKDQWNKYSWNPTRQTYMPDFAMATRFVMGVDPYKYGEKTIVGKRMSKGGAAVFYKNDAIVDNGAEMDNRISDKFIMTFLARVGEPDEFAAEMLKMCILIGSMCYPERNVDLIQKKFREWGCEGYLLYNVKNGQKDVEAGVYVDVPVKQQLFQLFQSYVKNRGQYDNHVELLNECYEIGGPDEMTDYDLFSAGGYALLGCLSTFASNVSSFNASRKIEKVFAEY
jgi:hypothetical protein